ncbi:MAG: NAD(P)H-dependent oxidoreductase [Rhizobiales bacterium]|nr:NAD(P)H-dependent oxidoreductase [Hyphomicrobiales bacterium]
MLNILHIDSSARIQGSHSRALGAYLIEQFKQKTECNICYRDVNIGLHLLTPEYMSAFYTKPAERSKKQNELTKISDQLVAELKQCDKLVITLPMYNNNIPASLKMWQDLAMRDGETFCSKQRGIVGLLKNKQAIIIVTTGGMPNKDDDFLIEKLTRLFLNAMGITDQTYIHATELAYNQQASIAAAQQQIAAINL